MSNQLRYSHVQDPALIVCCDSVQVLPRGNQPTNQPRRWAVCGLNMIAFYSSTVLQLGSGPCALCIRTRTSRSGQLRESAVALPCEPSAKIRLCVPANAEMIVPWWLTRVHAHSVTVFRTTLRFRSTSKRFQNSNASPVTDVRTQHDAGLCDTDSSMPDESR